MTRQGLAALVTLSLFMLLSGCFKSTEPLFKNASAHGNVLADHYIVTDGKKPLGELRLKEDKGVYTVVASSDEKASVQITPGRTFTLHRTQLSGHALERTFGSFDFYWVQSKEVENPEFGYDLIAIARQQNDFVFRWSAWLLSDNQQFVEAVMALDQTHPGLVSCDGKDIACAFTDRSGLKLIEELIIEHQLSPIRALVPR